MGVALQKVTFAELIVLLDDFNAHVITDNKTWKGFIGRKGDFDIKRNKRCLLQFCATNGVCIMNTFFWHKMIHKWVGQHIIDSCAVPADLFSYVVNIRVKEGAVLSTDHQLGVCILKGLNHLRKKKTIQSTKSFQKKKVRHAFVSNIAFLFRELPDFTKEVETVWDLFKSTIIASTAASCGCKFVGGQKGNKKKTTG